MKSPVCPAIIGLLTILACSASLPLSAGDPPEYPLHYHVTLDPDTDSAEITIELDHGGLVREINFNIDSEVHSDISANGDLQVEDGRAIWAPPAQGARLTLTARVSHERDDGSYDALMTEDWAIFRGDDLIPAARVRTSPDAESRALLSFTLPEHWTSVITGWEKLDDREFKVENPERRFSRPTGWMIAGRLGTRLERLGDTHVAVSAPRGSELRRLDVLTYLTLVWPELENAFGQTPTHLSVIGHGDPMWRGGLSGPNSLFLHADRPLVSENGTSALVHELVHSVTRIRGDEDSDDWIAEGLAEFYSFELLYRAGAMTASRRQKILDDLADWGGEVETLLKPGSNGETTARAVLLFDELDREIRERTDDEASLDDVVRELISIREVSLDDLCDVAAELAGEPLQALNHDVVQ